VLALTFVLTVLVDITMALMAGMALALLLKAKAMRAARKTEAL
jgi:MFS superfamily sulfate permease-like transporter